MSGAERGAPRWLVAGLWGGLALVLARVAVRVGLEHVGHGRPLERVLVRAADELPQHVLAALVLGVAVAALAALAERPGPARSARRSLVWISAGAVLGAWLCGWLEPGVAGRIGTATDRGRMAAAGGLAAGLALSALLVAGTRLRVARPGRESLAAQAVPSLLALVAALGVPPLLSRLEDPMLLRRTVRELAVDGAAWEVVRRHPVREPHVDVVTPASDYRVSGSDMRSLVLPPPAEVRFTVTEEDGPVVLTGQAGVDLRARRKLGELHGRLDVRFQVLVDGEPAFEAEVPVDPDDEELGASWVPLATDEDDAGVPLLPGAEVRLRTAVFGADGQHLKPRFAARLGFGGVALERTRQVERTPSSRERPNLVLVVMDTLRADRTSTYGYGRATTPRLDRLAARGVVYDEAYATASWTWPSTASILTGLHPEEHGVLGPRSCFLDEGVESVAEALQGAGYSTAAFTANPLIVPDKNFDQGFERFETYRASERRSERLVPAVVEWIEELAGVRFFLYVQLMDVHAPLDPLPEAREAFAADVPADFDPNAITLYHRRLLKHCGHDERGRPATERCVPPEHQAWIRDLYDACVWSGDAWTGRILDALERCGLADETVVAFTSDHGEELFQRGLATHGQGVHGELVRVPLVLAGPGLPRGVRVATPVSNRQLAPTLAQLGGAALDGVADPLDLADPAALADVRGPVYFSTHKGWWNGHHRQPVFGVRRDADVLHFAPQGSDWGVDEPDEGGQWRLFDVARDRAERADLAAERPDAGDELRELLLEALERQSSRRAGSGVEADAATLDLLREIGYLGDDD